MTDRYESDSRQLYSPFLFKRQFASSVFSKLSRDGNVKHTIQNRLTDLDFPYKEIFFSKTLMAYCLLNKNELCAQYMPIYCDALPLEVLDFDDLPERSLAER